MFTLLKSGWSTLLRGDATTSKFDFKQKVISSDDESYIFVPNRKRSHVSSISNMSNGADFKVKKEKQHSPTSDSDVGSVHVKFASSVDCETTTSFDTDVDMPVPTSAPSSSPPRMRRKPLLRRMMTIDMTELTLDGIPFQSATYEIEMHIREMLRDNPPPCPMLPDVEFDFALEKAVLGRLTDG